MSGNARIELAVRNAACTDCKLHRQADGDDRCITARGNHKAEILVVTKSPLNERAFKELATYLERAGFNPDELAYTGATKCLTWDLTANKTDQKACKKYFDAEMDFIKPKWILAIGNEALALTAGRSGIMKYRGLTFPGPNGSKVVATISPAMVYRNPGQKAGFEADLKYFHSLAYNTAPSSDAEPDEINYVLNKQQLKDMCAVLARADEVSFDLETSSFDEFKTDSRVISAAFTSITYGEDEADPDTWDCFAIPLWHPRSPWRSSWIRVLQLICKYVRRIKKRIAHNGKFDCRWLHQFESTIKITMDTMLGAAVLDENRPKGLKPLARSLLGAAPWDIDIKNKPGQPWWEVEGLELEDILRYNALDTWHTMRLYHHELQDLRKQPRLIKILQHILIPASNTLVPVEQHGVWADRKKIHKHLDITIAEIERIEGKLLEYVPEDHPYRIKNVLKNGEIRYNPNGGVNWNPSNFARWFLFDHLQLPVLERGKIKEDGSPGDPSMAESVMLELTGEHPVIDLLMERSGWEKNRQFFSAYAEQMDDDDRIHTTFKLTGTVTGRLSSGKEDADKVSGKVDNRGVNMQQVPRDPFVRGVFGAPPGSYFVEADYSQVELRVAAFLAQERNMLYLYSTGQDIHMAMAMRMTGKPESQVTKEERKKAKAVNFGFLYGMGWKKFISTAWLNYGVRVTEAEAQAARKAFFAEFPGLLPWHGAQRRFAHKHGYVVSPIGRVRHLPDIHSAVDGVAHEAERQAINSPVQGFASDMALWAMTIIAYKFEKLGLTARPIGAVHDAVNFEIPEDEMAIALPIIKDTMESLPLFEVFGVDLNVPIIADLKAGSRWGGATELTPEQVYNWEDGMVAV